jgi:hypothetical protein
MFSFISPSTDESYYTKGKDLLGRQFISFSIKVQDKNNNVVEKGTYKIFQRYLKNRMLLLTGGDGGVLFPNLIDAEYHVIHEKSKDRLKLFFTALPCWQASDDYKIVAVKPPYIANQ